MRPLERDPNAIGVGYGVETIGVEDKCYCADCDCWHERAKQIMRFFDGNRNQIAMYFDLERQRLISAAGSIPIIRDGDN